MKKKPKQRSRRDRGADDRESAINTANAMEFERAEMDSWGQVNEDAESGRKYDAHMM